MRQMIGTTVGTSHLLASPLCTFVPLEVGFALFVARWFQLNRAVAHIEL